MLTPDELAQVSAHVREMANSFQFGRDGMVVPGSYDPATSTVSVIFNDTAVVFPDDQSQNPMTQTNVPLSTTHLDDGYGPFGGELVHLVPVQSGYTATLYRTPEPGVDSPGVPQGERWISLRNAAGEIVSYHKQTLDGSNAGDGLGGQRQMSGGYHSLSTRSGHNVIADDTLKRLQMASAGGLSHVMDDEARVLTHSAGIVSHVLNAATGQLTHTAGAVYTLFDSAGRAISHVVPAGGSLGLGAIASTLPSSRAAIANADVVAYQAEHFNSRLVDMKNTITALITAMQTSGVPSLPTIAAAIADLASLTPLPVPNGSSIVKLAS